MQRVKEQPETLTQEEQERLLDAPSEKAPTGLRNKCILGLMLHNGLGINDIVGLKVGDIDWEKGVLKSWEEEVNLRDRALSLLKSWLKILDAEESDYLFRTLKGGKINGRYVREMLRRESQAAGITKTVNPKVIYETYKQNRLKTTPEGKNRVENDGGRQSTSDSEREKPPGRLEL
ncbi:tyrosine-type recombinase/integrase [Desulfonatronospira sp.]|uniref:tyrosine-type recombinase/integrase n=1 Tax=Desulfonatronospira sp. TaxID=1962951 RepID=UPI0025B8B976|nr:tyrosine-type recombinase/integrase [Desulfonatronospira sp.]